MGGKIAMQVALSHPKRLRKLIVADIAPVSYHKRPNPALNGLLSLAETTIESRQQADHLLAQYIEEKQVRTFLLKNGVVPIFQRLALKGTGKRLE